MNVEEWLQTDDVHDALRAYVHQEVMKALKERMAVLEQEFEDWLLYGDRGKPEP